MNIQIGGWQDNWANVRERFVRDIIDIMFRYFHNAALFKNDLQIINIHVSNCPWADENPCTHFDRSRICLNVDGAFWCQFAHQLSHELCHCSTSRQQLPQKIKWFDEFICCCSSYLVETIIAQETTQKYEYLFFGRTKEFFLDYLKIESEGHIYRVNNIQEFFTWNKDKYQTDENLIKKHDVYVRSFFKDLNGDFSGLSFVGKMHLVQLDNDMVIEDYLQRLLTLCNHKEKSAIYQICKLFGLQLMRQMKESGIAWVGEIPQEWACTKIGAVFTENNHRNLFGKETKALQFNYGTIVPKKDFDSEDEYVAKTILNYTIVDKGMIMLNGLNLNFDFVTKRVAFVRERGVITSAYMSFYPTDKTQLTSKYAHYLLKSYDHCAAFHNMGGGVRKILNFNELKRQPFILPPLAEQQRIADFLDKECEKIDGLKADIQAQIDTLEQYKRSVITEAVTHGLNSDAPVKESAVWFGEIPSAWSVVKGKYVFAQRNNRGNNITLQLLSPTQKYGVIPQEMYEELSGMNAVKLNDSTNYALLKTLHKGDFCISLRSFQGGFEYSEYEGVVSPAYQVFYPIVNVDRGYYKYLFKEKGFIEVMNSYTMSLRDGKNIAFDDFGNTFIPVPPIDEQKAIAEYLNDKCAEIEKTIASKKAQLDILDEYKKSLIYEYVTGKKEVVA